MAKNILFFLLFTLFGRTGFSQLWQPVEVASIPEKVSNNAVVEGFIGDTPYVFSFAGIDSTKTWSGIHLKSFRYNTMADNWEVIPPLPDPNGGKIAAAASRIGDIIYIIGGYHVAQNGNETSSGKVHRYKISSNSYLPDGLDIPVPIDDHVQAVWNDSLIYIVTGWSNVNNVSNVQIYNPAENSWSVGSSVPNNTFYKAFGAGGTIVDDTIYYYGGAAIGANFPAQYWLRKGVINPADPLDITWSVSSLFGIGNKGYRMAAFESMGYVHWIGGSQITYNFDGIAYNGSGGVPLVNRNLFLNLTTGVFDTSLVYEYPMDLRSVADINPTTKYLAGGMLSGQAVTNKTFRLEREELVVTSIANPGGDQFIHRIYPNPASETIQIELETLPSGLVKLEIFDAFGKMVRYIALENRVTSIGIRSFPAGNYIFRITFENGKQASQRILIK